MTQGSSTNPPGATASSTSLYQDSLRDKANREWVEAKLEALKEDINETKKIALSGKRKAEEPHGCLHIDEIKALGQAVNGWKTLKFGALIGFAVILSAAIAQYYALTSKTEDTAQDVAQVKESVEAIASDVQEVTIAMDAHLDQYQEKERRAKITKEVELQAISEIVKSAIRESNTPNRNR